MESLEALGFAPSSVPRDGECYPRSLLRAAGKPAADADVLATRRAAVDLVCGTRAIGGIPAAEVRRREGMKVTPAAAEKQLGPWRAARKWVTQEGEEGLATAFQFGCAASVKPAVILEKGEGGFLNPCAVYALREGGLAVSHGTVPFCTYLPFEDVLARLRASPRGYAVLLYERAAFHYDPFLYRNSVSPTEVGEEDLDALADAELAAIHAAWQPVGLYMAKPVAGSGCDLAMYTCEIPCSVLPVGSEVRLEAPGERQRAPP